MFDHFTSSSPLILVGCGNMGKAMAEGWLKAGLKPEALYVVDPVASAGVFPDVPASSYIDGLDALPDGLIASALVLAVKPQIINDVLTGVSAAVDQSTMIISVAAGVTLVQMERGVGTDAQYVRAMPNTPAAIGAGITGLTAVGLPEEGKALAIALMSATGSAVWIESEDQMDAVTAVSGSGPAYVFHLVEAMAAAGVKEGLPKETAMALARQTIIGAGQLLAADPADAATLRERVTSPGGTTAAALSVLMQDEALAELMHKAIKAARIRGGELAG